MRDRAAFIFFLIGILLLVLAPAPLAFADEGVGEVEASFEVEASPGDSNGDGMVNAVDITSVERIILGLDPETPGADANGDGEINAVDITQIELIIMGRA